MEFRISAVVVLTSAAFALTACRPIQAAEAPRPRPTGTTDVSFPTKRKIPARTVAGGLYWDTSDEPGIQGGAGKWESNNWNPSPEGEGSRRDWKDGAVACFSTRFRATVEDRVVVKAIFIGSPDCTIEGGRISFEQGLKIDVNSGCSGRIVSTLTGGIEQPHFQKNGRFKIPFAGLYKEGSGSLTLAGANSYAGPTTITGGTLIIANRISLPDTTTLWPEAGAVLGVGYPVDQELLGRVYSERAVSFTIALAADSAGDLDFSKNPGLRTAYLGAIGKASYGGEVTPANNAYRLGGGGGRLIVERPLSGNRTVFVGGYRASGEVELAASSNIGNPVINGVRLKLGTAVVPPSPVSLSARLLPGHKVRLSWVAIKQDTSGFEIRASRDSASFRRLARVPAAGRTFTLRVEPETNTRYRVYARSGRTLSAGYAEAEVSTKARALRAPVLEEVYGSYYWIDLKWLDNNDGETGYRVQLSGDNRHFTDFSTTPADRERAHFKFAERGTHYFRVAALGASGRPGPWSEVKSARTDPDADLVKDIFERFDISSETRQMNPEAPASLPQYSDAEKKMQRERGERLIKDLEASARSDSVYVVPRGVYRLPAGVIRLSGLSNYTIRAPGVTFFIDVSGRRKAVFAFDDCENIAFEGPCTFNQAVPHWASAKITSIDSDDFKIEAEVLAGHSREFTDEGEFYLFNRHGHQIYELKYNKIDYLKNGRFIIHSSNWTRIRAHGRGFTVDDGCRYVALPSRHIGSAEAATGGRTTRNFTIRSVTSYGMLSGHGKTKGKTRYIGYRVLPQPGTTQLMAGQPGQFHMSKGDSLLFDGCEFNTGGDDGINLMSRSGVVGMQDCARKIYINRMYSGITPGMRLKFYDYKTFEYLGEATVTSAGTVETPELVNGGNLFIKRNGGRWYDKNKVSMVELDRDVGNVTYAQVFAPDLGADSVVVRNTYWRDMHAQALLLQGARSGLVINNFFYRSIMSAVHLSMSQYWQEGYWANNMILRNNVMLDNPVCVRLPNMASIEVGAHLGTPGAVFRSPCWDNIVIEGNTIVSTMFSGIRVGNVGNMVIKDNVIYRCGMADEPQWDERGAIIVKGGENITIEGNTYVVNDGPYTTGVLVMDDVDRDTLFLRNNRTIERKRPPAIPRIGK